MKKIETESHYEYTKFFDAVIDREKLSFETVGKDKFGNLILHISETYNIGNAYSSSDEYFILTAEEYRKYIVKSRKNKLISFWKYRKLLKEACKSLNVSDVNETDVVYQDDRYTLGREDDIAYLIADKKRYILTSHPYEPCLYITDENHVLTSVHNAFDPLNVLESFKKGDMIMSITGFEYNANDFCSMVEYAAGMGDINIDFAENVLKNQKKRKNSDQTQKCDKSHEDDKYSKNDKSTENDKSIEGSITKNPQGLKLLNDLSYSIISDYPDCVIDYSIVKDDLSYCGYRSHRRVLNFTCSKLFSDDEDGITWNYDIGKANANTITKDELFAFISKNDKLNYRKAFLYPPHECSYSEDDFDRVNSVLFPNGKDGLEIYEWTTDWSDYFDDGHEWWGALCYTVYDKTTHRFTVIMASATD